MLARGVISILIGGASAAVASLDLTPTQVIEVQNLERLAALYAIIFVGTVPAVVVAAFARGVIVRILRSVWQADPKKVSRLEKVINSAIRIVTVIGAGVLIGKT